ncbi:MAG: cysteine--tRNA ligase [Polyangiaceae bacterium]|nr:cysteine--tRNA ligase [Polyangiaceae bacterium]
MARLRLYDTLTRETREFEPRAPGIARVYLCGPTTYDAPHVGHARSALAPDVLVRRLRRHGYQVTYVRNVTDVDDKILARARERGEAPLELSARMAGVYQEQMRALGCLDPEVEPRVSQHLPEIVALVSALIAQGHAYELEMPGGTHDVYFAVRSFAGYGRLSRRKLDDLVAGARVERDDSKRDPLDFALWKGAGRDEWGWESPWGWGRPGWHIECSAMSEKHLGFGFDIHAGGMDLVFPHHENEIAQSEAAHPGCGAMASYWLHNGFVNVDKEKMAKSLGNFVTVSDVLERNDPEALRAFLLGVQYRGPVQFDTEKLADGRVVFPGVDEAERRVDYLYAAERRLRDAFGGAMTVPAKLPPELLATRDAVSAAAKAGDEALDDDLNTPVALASLGEIARLGNELADLAWKRRKDAGFVGAASVVARSAHVALRRLADDLGLLRAPAEEYAARTRQRRLSRRGLREADVAARVLARDEARRQRDFTASDRLRDELSAAGVTLRDGPLGTEWSLEP